MDILRTFIKTLLVAVVLGGGAIGAWIVHERYSSARQLAALQRQRDELVQIVHRLQHEKRVADILVSGQEAVEGVLHTTLLFVEYDRQGNALPAREFTIRGEHAHFDALVVKFEHGFIEQNDPLRGHSIALFTRVYGDQQSPREASLIDVPNTIPAVYRGADKRVTEFEMQLWRDFWKLAEDPAYRARHGVRVANGQGVWGPLRPDRLYTITIESTGGLNLTSEPLKGIYLEALKQKQVL